MDIIYVNEYRFGAELSSDELSELGISSSELDYSNIETRRVLWNVLSEARSYGIDFSLSGNVLIEAQENKDGGVRLYFTALPGNGGNPDKITDLKKKEKMPVLMHTDNLSAVIEACSALPKETESTLFGQNGKYRLFCFVSPCDKPYYTGVLGEYGTVKGSFCAAKLASCEETWSVLVSVNAVASLAAVK